MLHASSACLPAFLVSRCFLDLVLAFLLHTCKTCNCSKVGVHSSLLLSALWSEVTHAAINKAHLLPCQCLHTTCMPLLRPRCAQALSGMHPEASSCILQPDAPQAVCTQRGRDDQVRVHVCCMRICVRTARGARANTHARIHAQAPAPPLFPAFISSTPRPRLQKAVYPEDPRFSLKPTQ